MLAKYLVNNTMTDVPITTGGIAMPTGSAFMVTGTYIYNGVSYDCSQEGLYRFFNEANGTVLNKIAFLNLTGGADIYKVMSGISCNHLHGIDDNNSNYQAVANAGRYRKWRNQCGYIAGMVNWLMPQIGFTSRTLNPQTLQTLNGWDDGHVIVETQHSGVWRMWDITNGCYFRDSNGVHMSTSAFIAQIANGGTFPTKVSLDNDVKFNSQSAGTSGNIDLQIYGELYHADNAENEAWYRRIFQTL